MVIPNNIIKELLSIVPWTTCGTYCNCSVKNINIYQGGQVTQRYLAFLEQ